ncbi:hypothetical protein Glove_49g22 [Diversispora epigaea]|uniref:AN1-type domain-containing protein n=1 Tax=Diversispora epigaea TaxID=1348612 RepID=A0A397JH90_9GLOM|nr:hypothetical protein Glove_49g22 [Diversispora epigaea]
MTDEVESNTSQSNIVANVSNVSEIVNINNDNDNSNDNNNVQNTSTVKVKKKKKKKQKSTSSNSETTKNSKSESGKVTSGKDSSSKPDDLDEIVAHILSDAKPSTINLCSMPKCKQSLKILSYTCQYCNMTYCVKHRHPEAHSEKCVEKMKNTVKAEFKQESHLFISQERKTPGSTNKGFNVEKNKEELRKRYKEKLEKARREERGK